MRLSCVVLLALAGHQAAATIYYGNATRTVVSTTSLADYTYTFTTKHSTVTSTAVDDETITDFDYSTLPPSTYSWESTSEWMSFIYNNESQVPSTVITVAPTVAPTTYSWYQAITPQILGTVYVIINNLNQTRTTTVTNSSAVAANTQYLKNGTLVLLTRTDVNEAGTVTAVVPTGGNSTTTVAYPTGYYTIGGAVEWVALTPFTGTLGGFTGTCCGYTTVASPVPQSHHSWPLLTGSTDPVDTRGWLYSITSHYEGEGVTGSQALASLFSPATINSVINYCPYDSCPSSSALADVSAVGEAGDLLTTTVHVTAPTSSTTNAKATPAASAASTTPTPAPYSSKSSVVSAESQVQGSSQQSSQASALQAQSTQQQSSVVSAPAPSSASSSENNAASIIAQLGAHTTVTVSSSKQSAVAGSGPTTAESQSVQEVSLPTQSSPRSSNALAPVTVGSAVLTPASNSEYVAGSQTLAVGSSLTLGSGASTTIVALQTSGSQTYLVVGSATSLVGTPQGQAAGASTAALTIGSAILTPTNSEYVIGSQTLLPGSSITIGSGSSTTVVALYTSASATVLVVGSSTSTLSKAASGTPASENPAPITIGSTVITPNSDSAYVIGSQTLSPGSVVTVSGTPYSLAPGATELVIGTSTEVLTTEAGMASYIWSAIGGAQSTGTASLSGSGVANGTTASTTTFPGTSKPAASASAGSQTSTSSGGSNLQVVGFATVLALAMVVLAII